MSGPSDESSPSTGPSSSLTSSASESSTPNTRSAETSPTSSLSGPSVSSRPPTPPVEREPPQTEKSTSEDTERSTQTDSCRIQESCVKIEKTSSPPPATDIDCEVQLCVLYTQGINSLTFDLRIVPIGQLPDIVGDETGWAELLRDTFVFPRDVEKMRAMMQANVMKFTKKDVKDVYFTQSNWQDFAPCGSAQEPWPASFPFSRSELLSQPYVGRQWVSCYTDTRQRGPKPKIDGKVRIEELQLEEGTWTFTMQRIFDKETPPGMFEDDQKVVGLGSKTFRNPPAT